MQTLHLRGRDAELARNLELSSARPFATDLNAAIDLAERMLLLCKHYKDAKGAFGSLIDMFSNEHQRIIDALDEEHVHSADWPTIEFAELTKLYETVR